MVAYTIAIGRIIREYHAGESKRVEIELQGFRVTLSYPFGSGDTKKPVSWLVTGFEVEEEGASEHSSRLPGYAPGGQFINRQEGASPEGKSTPGTHPRKVNPSAAEKRRQALRGVEASGSLEGVPKVMARRFQAKGYIREEGGRWTLTKMGRAVMEGRIGAAGRGAVDLGGARHKAERAGGRRKARGQDMAAYMAGDGEAQQRRQARQEREYYEQEGDRLKAEWEARGAELARAQAAEDRALGAVLGPTGKTHAVKLALEDRPFRRQDLDHLRAAGWTLRPAGTVPAKVGRSLPAGSGAEWNPADELERLLGPRGEARAVVIQSEGAFGEDLVRRLMADGYDVSPAPRGYRQGHARAVNPEPSPALKRAVYEALKKATPKGGATAEDLARKVKAPAEEVEAALERHELTGLAHRRRDVHSLFGSVWEAGMDLPGFFSGAEAQQPLPMFNPKEAGQSWTVLDTQKKGPRHAGPMSRKPTGRRQATMDTKGTPTPHPVPAAPKRAKKAPRPTSHPRKRNPAPELESMTKLIQRIAGPGVSLQRGPRGTFVLEGKKAAVKRAAKLLTEAKTKGGWWILESLEEIRDPEINAAGVDAMAWIRLEDAPRVNPSKPIKKAPSVPKSGTTKAPTRRKPGRGALAFNPSDAEGLAKVWTSWTGADPGQSLRIQVEEPRRYGLPPHVVLLGRVAWLATKDGKEIRFGVSGPYMVTDAEAKKIWLVSHKGHEFDLEPALIGYTARKPKFGDKATIEYVHAFEGRTHAVMHGQVGALTGRFRITPAGLEG